MCNSPGQSASTTRVKKCSGRWGTLGPTVRCRAWYSNRRDPHESACRAQYPHPRACSSQHGDDPDRDCSSGDRVENRAAPYCFRSRCQSGSWSCRDGLRKIETHTENYAHRNRSRGLATTHSAQACRAPIRDKTFRHQTAFASLRRAKLPKVQRKSDPSTNVIDEWSYSLSFGTPASLIF